MQDYKKTTDIIVDKKNSLLKFSSQKKINKVESKRIVESNALSESIKLVVGNTIFEGKILTTKKIN